MRRRTIVVVWCRSGTGGRINVCTYFVFEIRIYAAARGGSECGIRISDVNVLTVSHNNYRSILLSFRDMTMDGRRTDSGPTSATIAHLAVKAGQQHRTKNHRICGIILNFYWNCEWMYCKVWSWSRKKWLTCGVTVSESVQGQRQATRYLIILRLQNDLLGVEWNVKPQAVSLCPRLNHSTFCDVKRQRSHQEQKTNKNGNTLVENPSIHSPVRPSFI